MKTLIIVPAFNEAESICDVIADLKTCGYKDIVVIDDGSTDNSGKLASQSGAVILPHLINRGLGAALGTGFEYAKAVNADITVTFDSDGQHRACDIEKLISPIITKKADVVIGSRMLNLGKMPFDRKIINILANWLTFLFYGVKTTDSQSGLRAFNNKSLNLIQIKTDRMEVSSEILKEIKKNNLKFLEIPIMPIYSQYSRNKGQDGIGNLNAINVSFKMFLRLFR